MVHIKFPSWLLWRAGLVLGTGWVCAWCVLVVLTAVDVPCVARCVVRDILDVISPSEHEYFRKSREKRFGRSLEDVVADRKDTRILLKQTLYPIRKALEIGPFLGGDNPNFSDYAIFGAFMWARVTSSFQLLELSDPIYNWRERMLLLYDGLAKNAPAVDI